MSRQRIRHFAVALVLSAVFTAASVEPTVAGLAAPSKGAPAAAPAQALVSTVAAHTSREIFGFALASSLSDPTVGYPSWNFDLLSTVAFFGLHVDTGGRFVGDNGWTVWNSSALTNLVSIAHQHGVKVVLTIVLQDFSSNTPNMCAGLAHADATVAQTVSEVKAKGVDGVNIDYEGLDGSCGSSDPYWAQHAMTSFTAKMRAGLGSSPYLSIDTYAGAAADPYGFFDVVGLATYVDSMFVMAYDMEYSNYYGAPLNCSRFCLGPTSPLTSYRYNNTTVMNQYIAAATASKVILGVPYFGRKACVAGLGPNQYPTSSVVADSYLDASTEFSYFEVQPGSYVAHREANSSGMERWDTWFNTVLNCTRELYWDDTVSLGKKYDLVNADGLRGVGIWNLNYGGGAPELWAALQSHFAACAGPALTASPASPQVPGAPIQLAATSSGCPNPRYQFWILAPGSSTWTVAQPYSSAATFSWYTTGLAAGSYRYTVWVRDAGSSGAACNNLGCFDAYTPATAYALTITPCTAATESAAPLTTAPSGTSVTFTASASGCPNPRYQFWILAPDSTTWTIAQPYSSTATFTWNTTGLPAGSYRYTVWVRDAGSAGTGSNSLGTFDAYFPSTAYTLNSPCTAVTESAAPPSTATGGTAVAFTASASGCPNPRYQFWLLAPGSTTWTIAQAYSSTATFNWNTNGLAAGSYRYTVWVRDAGSAGTNSNNLGSFDAYFPATAYTVNSPCTSVSETAAPPTIASAGNSVTFTAGASGCPNPLYQFWLLAPGSTAWTIAQPYSSTATFTWNTTGLPPGTYRYTVWVRDAGSAGTGSNSLGTFDAYFPSTAYTLNSPCTAVTESAAPSSTAKAGTAVTFTAGASSCPNPLYQFWTLAPGSTTWTIAQAYSSTATFTWNTTGLATGSYRYTVWVRDAGSTGTSSNNLGTFDALFPSTAYALT